MWAFFLSLILLNYKHCNKNHQHVCSSCNVFAEPADILAVVTWPKQNTDHALALAHATSTNQLIIDHAAQKHSDMDFTVFFKLFSDSEGVRSVFPITAISLLPESAMICQYRACALATLAKSTISLGVCARARVHDTNMN